MGQAPLSRLVCIKRIRASFCDSAHRDHFLDEARIATRMEHNNILPVVDAGEIDGQLYIATQAVQGRSLDQVRASEPPLPAALSVYVIRELLRALDYIHRLPGVSLVYRALSPLKINLEWNGSVRLANFACASSAIKLSETLPGTIRGELAYMSPEQARGQKADPRSDVYAAASLLWELLTRQVFRPAERLSLAEVAQWKAESIRSHAPHLDAQLEATIQRGLCADPEKRWPDALSMMQRLSQWLAERAPEAGQEGLASFMRESFDGAEQKEHLAREALLHREWAPAIREIEKKKLSSIRRLSSLEDSPFRQTRSGHGLACRSAESGTITTPITNRSDLPTGEPSLSPVAPQGSTVPAIEESSAQRARPLVAPPEKLNPGSVIAQRYRIEARLGRGGMGTVYRARHLQVGRWVAVKVLARAWSRDEDVARRFRAEARAASAAGHPNIVEVFDAGELSDGRLFLVMEFLEGQNLYDLLRAEGRMKVEEAIEVMCGVARAVKAAHDVGVIHRDLKPDNVMLVDRGAGESRAIKVLDFGISAMMDERNETRWTKPGHAVGTPEYMAPEQARGVSATNLFDVYAWGVMFFEMLSGQAPLTGSNFVDVMAKKNDEAAPSLAKLCPELPLEVCELVDDCLRIEPELRPQSMGEVLVRLGKCQAKSSRQTPRVAPPVGSPTPRVLMTSLVPDESAEESNRSRSWVFSPLILVFTAAAAASLWWGIDAMQWWGAPKIESMLAQQQHSELLWPEQYADPKTSLLERPVAAVPPARLRTASLLASPKSNAVRTSELSLDERSLRCDKLEERIIKAQRAGRSALMLGLLRSGRDFQCWKGGAHRIRWARWRVHALKESKRWSDCRLAARAFHEDPEVFEDLQLCSARERMERERAKGPAPASGRR